MDELGLVFLRVNQRARAFSYFRQFLGQQVQVERAWPFDGESVLQGHLVNGVKIVEALRRARDEQFPLRHGERGQEVRLHDLKQTLNESGLVDHRAGVPAAPDRCGCPWRKGPEIQPAAVD